MGKKGRFPNPECTIEWQCIQHKRCDYAGKITPFNTLWILCNTFKLLYVMKNEPISSDAAITLGSNLRKLRKKHHMTQEQLAAALDVTAKHIGEIESGKSFISGVLLDQVVKYFSISYDELFLSDKQIKSFTIEAARMASEMLKKNYEDFDKQYGIELKLDDKEN